MPYCPRCNAETKEGDKFCVYCGAPLATETLKPAERRSYVRERDTCFGEEEKDYLGLVSLGFFLLAVGITYTLNTNIIEDFRFWIEELSLRKTIVEPPSGLIFSATIFFGSSGIFSFIKAIVRIATNDIKRRILADIFSGLALLLFAYLIKLYGTGALSWQTALGTEIIVCGLLVALYSIISSLLRRR
ncbi:MAG: zinc ribbon domain-containing protein [Candidatus Bathyarchaeia archaeon]|nr:zinc ribbon domain-containing protein [Candidatus Bathyarchaeota archaeon]